MLNVPLLHGLTGLKEIDPALCGSDTGIAAFALSADIARPDEAYPWVLDIVPAGIKGLIFAALIAAIVSSFSAIINSTSTILPWICTNHS